MEKLSMCRVCLGEDIGQVPIVGPQLEEMNEYLVLLPSEQVKLPGIYDEKMVQVLGMESYSVGVEAVKCEVKDEPNDEGVSDYVLPADSDTKNEEGMDDADSDGVETLVLLCDVKDEQSDPGDVSEDVLEESRVSDCVPSADSHNDFVTTVKVEQIGHRTNVSENVLEESRVSDCVPFADSHDDSLIIVKVEQVGHRTNVSEDVLEESGVSDDVLSADSDTKNEESMGHVLEMDADSDGVETLVLLCDVKDEQSDPGDVSEDVLEESRVSDCVPSADSHDDSLITVKVEQIGHRTSVSPPKDPAQDVQRSFEDTTSNNLNEHKLFQDTFKKLHDVTAAEIPDDNKEITASVQYTCDTCQQCYSSKCELERHVSLCSNVWKKDLSRENTTSAHTHAAQKPHQCNVCNKRYSRIRHLTRHMFAHTDEYLIFIPYQCHVCKEQFSQRDNLIRHVRTHSSSSRCKKELSIKSNLNSHMRPHTGKKLYQCDICKKQYSLKGNLTKHKHKHTGEKPYHCDICKKQFTVKDSLTKHMSTHTGEKPHNCCICKKQFAQKSSLNRHNMRTHTGEKPYVIYVRNNSQ